MCTAMSSRTFSRKVSPGSARTEDRFAGGILTGIVRLVPVVFSVSLAAAAPVDFVRDVRPIFEKHCCECHGGQKQKSGLRFDVKAAALKGGDSGEPCIVPGAAAKSFLIRLVASVDEDERMPSKGPPLSPGEIATLTTWINEGAVWPDGVDTTTLIAKTDWWSLKPLHLPRVGALKPEQRIDEFVAAKRAEKGLAASPRADRRTLIRRLFLVVHGLPPTLLDVEAFVADKDPRAYEKLVDRVLASPRYGEEMAQHWLDVIGWGETHGFEINTPRNSAWPFRDYVIEAFNSDRPYARFILEQLAGDSVAEDRATGFLMAKPALLPGQIGKDQESKDRARQDELNDMVTTTGAAFMGMTLQCARCHDHKFDPVTQADYYSLQAIFAGVRNGERLLHPDNRLSDPQAYQQWSQEQVAATLAVIRHEPVAGSGGLRSEVNGVRNIDRFAPVRTQKVRFSVKEVFKAPATDTRAFLDEFEVYSPAGRNVAREIKGVRLTASPTARAQNLTDGRYGARQGWSTNGKPGWVEIDFGSPQEIEAVVWSRDRSGRLKNQVSIDYQVEVEGADRTWRVVAGSETRATATSAGEKSPAEGSDDTGARAATERLHRNDAKLAAMLDAEMVYAGKLEKPGAIRRLARGDVNLPKEEVPPGAPREIGPPLVLPAASSDPERRAALARWIAQPENPLTGRVMVNRLWQWVFGAGLVATPSDFGHQGAQPTQPELLDWLAQEFSGHGGSVKHVMRLLLLSGTFQQSSHPNADGMALDAGNRLLWRFAPRRVDAEDVRDGMLQLAGTLDLRMGGPGFSVFEPNDSYVRIYKPKESYGAEEWRRMIYMTRIRVAKDSTFGAFDCPDFTQDQAARTRSTTALQALNLFNSPFVMEQAGHLAARVQREAPGPVATQVQHLFRLALHRPPSPQEAAVCTKLALDHGLPAVCRMIFNTNELLFVP